jgi:serine/threonine-protein kinase RsbT
VEDEVRVIIQSDTDIVLAREHGRLLGRKVGFSTTELTIIATAISEVARNILVFAKKGEIIIYVIDQNGRRGIGITAQDKGPGIRDISLAMKDGYSTGRGLGLGLPGTRRLVDEFQVISTVGAGTTVTMRKWVTQNE